MKFPKLKNKAILSPMSGVTDVAFRELCKDYGAGLTYTEFVSSAAIVRENERTLDMIQISPKEKPVGVQLFGSNEQEVVEAAKKLESKFDIIDINCGCPAWTVIKNDAGSALLKNPEKIARLVSKLSSAIKKPVTVKIRIGIDEKTINAVEIAKKVEDAGASAIAVHGRTQKQGYSGEANWDIIKKVKEAVNIPVIGNGDITRPEIFKQRLEESGVDYIMIGRAAMTNPYIFRQIVDFEKMGAYQKVDKVAIFKEYLKLAEKYGVNFLKIKTHAVQFSKGIKGGSQFRMGLSQCHEIECIKKLFGFFP